MRRAVLVAVLGTWTAAAACGGDPVRPAADPAAVGIPVGLGPRYQPPARWSRARAGLPIGALQCRAGRAATLVGVHIELFAGRRVVLIPPGIGIGGRVRREGAYVRGGRCRYPVSTTEPTGVLDLDARERVTLGDVFRIWGQPLSPTRLAGFRAPPGTRVALYVGGRAWRGDPRSLPLRRHQVIVLEVGGHVPPHRSYRFPPGR